MKRIIVYGLGEFFGANQSEIENEFEVIAYVDRIRIGEFVNGCKVISIEQALLLEYDFIYVSTGDMKNCFEMISYLLGEKVASDKIIVGKYHHSKVYDKTFVSELGEIVIEKDGCVVATRNLDEWNNISDIFEEECYNYNGTKGEAIVFDIGMNIGAASLYFASRKDVKKVFAFEPFSSTYKQAQKNIEASQAGEKITSFQYGISDCNKKCKIKYNAGMSCGQSTLPENLDFARNNYVQWKLIDKDQYEIEEIMVRDIREIYSDLIDDNTKSNLVFKIDCEGEEYAILPCLEKAGILSKIKIIMLEYHYKGSESINKILEDANFMFWDFKTQNNCGLIYALNNCAE